MLFISLTIAFSSFESLSSSAFIGGGGCPFVGDTFGLLKTSGSPRGTTLDSDTWDRVGDGDRDGVRDLILYPVAVSDLFDALVLRPNWYLVGTFRTFTPVGRFQ